MTMPTADPYFACATPRTGGTLLLDLPKDARSWPATGAGPTS
ncbi:hypothetical protein [Nonomuraea sp. NPDC003709]